MNSTPSSACRNKAAPRVLDKRCQARIVSERISGLLRGSIFVRVKSWWGLLLLLTLLGWSRAQGAQLMVFAAASLTDCLREVAREYHIRTKDSITFNFAASSFLARQLQEGAEADIFFSADEAKMDGLEQRGLLLPATRKTILSNSLVIVVASDSSLRVNTPDALTNSAVHRIALADPKTVPAGIYARQYLQKVKLWNSLQPKIVPLDNVRSALASVESGDIEVGIVYATDAAISRHVRIAYRVPQADAPAISYPAAILRSSSHPAEARAFLKYLASAPARRVFQKFGFILVTEQHDG